MRTHYFLNKILSDKEKEEVFKLINSEFYKDAIKCLNKLEPIHIGVSNDGFKFLFDYNKGRYYDYNRNSINRFLTKKQTKIVDSNGKELSVDEFWNIVDTSMQGIGFKEYYEKNCSEEQNILFLADEYSPFELDEYNPQYFEFYNDGLRFSTFSEFENK